MDRKEAQHDLTARQVAALPKERDGEAKRLLLTLAGANYFIAAERRSKKLKPRGVLQTWRGGFSAEIIGTRGLIG